MANTPNQVSLPPLNVPMINSDGTPSRVWSAWFRDLYKRTADKGGNAIDDNKGVIDGTIKTLEEVIAQVLINIIDISGNSDDIATNALAIQSNTDNLETHELLETAHGSNGDIVGFDDLADEITQGLVKRMALLTDAIASTVDVVQADASVAPAAYSQAHSQELVDLSNANKAAINTLVTDFNNAVTVLNNLIARSKASGQMTT
tara:strand:- start:1788 stop:2399 length:612 start_codon:yes stop_codon:yes gene_type:complete